MNRAVRALAIALVVSVLLNVFFLGLLTARAVHRRGGLTARDHGPGMPDRGHWPAAAAEVWRKQEGGLQASRDAVVAARRGVRTALTAEPFDPAAFEAALAKLRAETSEAQMAFHKSLMSTVREMKPEERRALGESRWFSGPEHRGEELHRR